MMKRKAAADNLPLFRKQQLIDDRSGVPLTVTRWIAPNLILTLVRRFTAAMDSTRPPESIEPIADSAAFDQALFEAMATGYQDTPGRLADIEAFLDNNTHLVRRFGRNAVVQTFARETREWLGRVRAEQAFATGQSLAVQAAALCDSLAHHLLLALRRAGYKPRDKKVDPADLHEMAGSLHVPQRNKATLIAKRNKCHVSTIRRRLHNTK